MFYKIAARFFGHEMRGYLWLPLIISGLLRLMMFVSVLHEVTDDVHFLMWNADNIDGIAANQIENHMLAFWETVVSLANICSVSPQ